MKKSSNQFQEVLVPSEKLQHIHPDVTHIAKLASDAPWLIESSRLKRFSAGVICDMLNESKITVVKSRGGYLVVGGFRSWSIFINYFREHRKPEFITIKVLKRTNAIQRQVIAMESLFVPLLPNSLGKNSLAYIGHCWEFMLEHHPELCDQWFDKGKITKSKLQSALGKSYASLYPNVTKMEDKCDE